MYYLTDLRGCRPVRWPLKLHPEAELPVPVRLRHTCVGK